MAQKPAKKRYLLYAVGACVMLVSLGYIGLSVWSQRAVLEAFRPDKGDALLLLLSTVTYGATGFLLAEAWRYLLVWSGERNVRPAVAIRVYARSQIARYIAGNLAQLASRQMLGRMAGWSHLGLGVSGLFELVSQITMGAIITLVAVAVTGLQTGQEMGEAAAVLLAVVALALLILPRLGRYITARYAAAFGDRLLQCRLSALWPAALDHFGFFIVGGIVLDLIIHVVMPGTPGLSDLPAMIGLFAAAWLCGCITPGAPAGIGVREAVLTFGLASLMPEGEALLVAALLRLVTVAGDVLFFAWAGRATARPSGEVRESTDPTSSSPPRIDPGPYPSAGA